MSLAIWVSLALGVALILVALGLAAVLWWRGRHEDARALAGFVPDCIVLGWRLIRDPRVHPARKLLLLLLVGYLANPLDILPGSAIDDAIVAALILRIALHRQASLVEELWPGPPASLGVLLRITEGRRQLPAPR